MTTVDANELLERIRGARDWAKAQEELGLEGESEDHSQNLAWAINGAAFKAVRTALDEILEPGSGAQQN
jgi:hypothetical protein